MASPATIEIATDHPALPGHFPGQPVVPGAVLLAEVLEALLGDPAAAAWLGPAPRLAAVKFLRPVLPGARLRIEWTCAGARLRFEVAESTDSGLQAAASGQFDRPTPPA